MVIGNGVPLTPRRLWFARVGDAAGLVLLAYFLWQLILGAGPSFDRIGLVLGATGIAAGWLARRPGLTTTEKLAATYVALTVLSTVAHHFRVWPVDADGPIAPWRPAVHAVVLLGYLIGVRFLLATPQRVGAVLTVIVVATFILGVNVLYDRVGHPLSIRIPHFPSADQWTGWADLGLVFGIVLPIPLAAVMASSSPWLLVGAACLSLAFLLDVTNLFSRAALPTVALTYIIMAGLEFVRLKRSRLAVAAVVGALLVGAGVRHPVQSVQALLAGGTFGRTEDALYGSRFRIWELAAQPVRDHPWLGVGPGNYTILMQTVYYRPGYFYPDYRPGAMAHAHNMLLHVADESGIPAALAFLSVWVAAFSGLLRAFARDRLGMLAIAVFGALLAFFLRCLGDHFMSGFLTSDRIGFLLWTLFAAAVAIIRLREAASSSLAPALPQGDETAYAATA